LCYEAEEQSGNVDSRNQKSDPSSQFQLSAFSFSAFSPLRVLFLGQVILRKGIQYLIEAARKLVNENIRFDIVGPVGISEEAVASAPKNMKFHGRANRTAAAGWYQQADLFVLPTLSDGFALTQLEAMAHGLPVITTPCCGEVVSNGADGFIIPPRDVNALAVAFQRYLNEPRLLQSQRATALEKSRRFSLERLAENLESLEAELEGRGEERRAWSGEQLKATSRT
jgi:glycosyltransferase involved in cell wall biosynthesis